MNYVIVQLLDVVKGLHYLHSCKIVHGDLKGVRRCLPKYTYGHLTLLILGQHPC